MTFRPLLITLFAWLLSFAPTFASEGGEHKLPLNATPLFDGFPYITNSMLMVWIAVGVIVIFCRAATRKMVLVPGFLQNFAEWVVEGLYDFLTGILGEYMVKKTFWFFASVFLLILVTNWLSLFPGVGTVGILDGHGGMVPFLRGGNADLNMTIAGKNSIELKDILIGEVWLVSGQSNMQWRLPESENGEAATAAANHPSIRLFNVSRDVAFKKKEGKVI